MDPVSLTLLTVAGTAAGIGGLTLLALWALKREADYRYTRETNPDSPWIRWVENHVVIRGTTFPVAVMLSVLTVLSALAASLAAPKTPPEFRDFSTPGAAELTADLDSDAWAAECEEYTIRRFRQEKGQDKLSFRCESFTGAGTLWEFHSSRGGRETRIQYQLTVEEGRGELALIHPDGTVTRLSEEPSPYRFLPGEGTTRLRLLGEGGKLELTLSVTTFDGPGGYWPKWTEEAS